MASPPTSPPATRRAELALRLTALALLLHPVGGEAIRPSLLAIAGAALLFPAWLRSPAPWAALAALAGLRVALDWPLADNHAYLLAYWCLAASIALTGADADACLARNGRLLVGIVFALASAWKFASPDFLDGTFLGVTCVRDPRFEGVTRLLAGWTPQDLAQAREVLSQHVDGISAEAVAGVALPARLRGAVLFGTHFAFALEAAVAALFLWPGRRGPARLRDAALMLFCATTYAVATVEGFAWLLLAMGVAQCEQERRVTRAAYLAVFGLVLLYRSLPWASWLADRFAAQG